jgi:hypothetical protein
MSKGYDDSDDEDRHFVIQIRERTKQLFRSLKSEKIDRCWDVKVNRRCEMVMVWSITASQVVLVPGSWDTAVARLQLPFLLRVNM